MKTIISALPMVDNTGVSTFYQRAVFFASLRSSGVRFELTNGCEGFWYGENDRLFSAAVVSVEMTGSETAINAALATFGRTAKQFAMLAVTVTTNEAHILGRAIGKSGADKLAKQYGGATLFPNGIAVAYDYAALAVNVDYNW